MYFSAARTAACKSDHIISLSWSWGTTACKNPPNNMLPATPITSKTASSQRDTRSIVSRITSLAIGLEPKAYGVHAVMFLLLAFHLLIKYMPQMPATFFAIDLRPVHAQ